MNQAGLVVIAMAGLWIAYLVPHHLTYRQQLLEARADDRFSERLRVVRVLRGARAPDRPVGRTGRPEPLRLHPVTRQADERARRGVSPMERPHGTSDRVAADLVRRSAAEHAQRAAHLARRSAAARRRAVLTLVLLVAVPAAWVAVPLASLSVLVGAVPSVLLLGVLVAGRRAVVAAARADAAWEEGAPYRLPAPRREPSVVGRAVRPSDAVTEVMARVPRVPVQAGASAALAEAAAAVAAARPAAAPTERRERVATTPRAAASETSGPSWVPVPVPRPTYTLKPEARRPEPAPLPEPTEARGTPVATATATVGEPASDDVAAPAEQTRRPAGTARPGGLDLDAVLARRRAAGE